MGILDVDNSFTFNKATGAKNQTLPASTPFVSTNIIDIAGAAKDVGPGNPIMVLIQITGTPTAGSCAGLTFTLQTDTVEALSSPTELWSVTIPIASVTQGQQIWMPVPINAERYMRLSCVEETAALGAADGTYFAGVQLDAQQGFAHTF